MHGSLNIIGWGTLLPVGIIFPRYFRKFPFAYERWFRGHLTCQLLAFVIGTIGWALGISLGGASKNYTFTTHRIIGITIYSLATLQVSGIQIFAVFTLSWVIVSCSILFSHLVLFLMEQRVKNTFSLLSFYAQNNIRGEMCFYFCGPNQYIMQKFKKILSP